MDLRLIGIDGERVAIKFFGLQRTPLLLTDKAQELQGLRVTRMAQEQFGKTLVRAVPVVGFDMAQRTLSQGIGSAHAPFHHKVSSWQRANVAFVTAW